MKTLPLLSTAERCVYGIIVTWVNEKGEERVRHHPGIYIDHKVPVVIRGKKLVRRSYEKVTATDALCEAIALSEKWEGNWKVQTISTPQTIYTDMNGARTNGQCLGPPEPAMLQRVGRIDLWAGEYKSDKEHYRKQRRKGAKHPGDEADTPAAAAGGPAAGGPGGRVALVLRPSE